MANARQKPEGLNSTATPRREALLRLLRVGGLSGATAAAALWLRGRSRRPEEETPLLLARHSTVTADTNYPEIVIAQGDDPRSLVRKALERLGGIRRFIARGDVVVIKPNISWDRTPEQAANTNPQAVAEMVRECLDAGAKRVIVTDVSCNEPHRCFQRSGIAAAASAEGAEVILPEENLFRPINLRGDVLGEWPVLEPFVAADKLINFPVAKSHGLTGVTLGMKNWYGILGGARNRLHQRIHESLADLADAMRPTLTLIDAYRVLIRNGPTGGSLDDVLLKKTLVAGTDPVALDAYVAKAYWGFEPGQLRFLKLAQDRGLGKMDFAGVRTEAVSV
ncbi:MAG TPA: DUF362 domain-containing protein [Terriglobia bacterium]|nr:DUF362 domain-containing protein [Terriglobia bacterium]